MCRERVRGSVLPAQGAGHACPFVALLTKSKRRSMELSWPRDNLGVQRGEGSSALNASLRKH